jgi:enoyl-[acyl-carrier protein] reductase/trans-2-enoyl-CoA reductase (NAD+)
MPAVPINPRFRGFICTSAHPSGCAQNVQRQIAIARAGGPGTGIPRAVVVGASAGYGLSSLITSVWGYGAEALGLCFERPSEPEKERTATAGWYNLAEVQRQAALDGRRVRVINGDACASTTKAQAIGLLQADGPIDLLVYSLAAPFRTDPLTGVKHASVLKPIGAPYTAKTVTLDPPEQVQPITLQPASEAEIANTVKVMGGEDWTLWLAALREAKLLAPGFRTVAYSYIGPAITHPIYRAGTIGRAKDDLEATARRMDAELAGLGGHAWVSINKALVTNASSAIPVVPLYISLLYKVMKARGVHEGTIEQMVRLFAQHIGPGRTPALDGQGRIRIDDREMDDGVQQEVARLWSQVDTANLMAISDFAGFRHDFRGLFGFELPGIVYDQPVEIDLPLA